MDSNIKIDFSNDEKNVINHINQKISAGNSLEEIFDSLFDELQHIMLCDRLDVGFIEDSQRIVLKYVKAKYKPILLLNEYIFDIYGTYLQKVFYTKNPFIIANLEKNEDHGNKEHDELLLQEGIQSSIICPIIIDNNPIGILCCRSKEIASYSDHHISLLSAIINILGQIIEKTYRIEQLTKTSQAYMEMLSFVSHEIKSPLASIITLGTTLTSGYFGRIDEKQRDIVKRMITKAEYLHNLSSQYLNLSRFESGEFKLNPQLIDFQDEIVDPIIEIIMPQIEERHIKFQKNYKESIYTIKCDPDLIRIVLVNILSNAIKYGNKEGEVKLSIERSFKRLKVIVYNEGPGFPASEKNRLFRKFSRLQSEELIERKGTGVGLYVSWKIIQLHGGRIWADSEHGKWALFGFELPQFMDMSIIY